MTTGATPLLSLSLPVEGELDGTWGDVVNYGITNYVDIAVAGTLSLIGDGAVTLANTAGTAGGTNITSTLTGAGTVTAQFAIIKVTGTLTTAKVVTALSLSKSYIVDNAATGGVVTFKASGQTGVSIAVGEKCTVYFNGTDYVKVASTVADGVTSVGGTGTVNGITLTGTVTSTGNLTLGGTLSGVNLASQVTGTLPIANGGTGTTSTTFANLTTNVTGTLPVANGGTGVTTSTGTGSTVLSASPTFTGTPLSTTAAVNTNTTQIATTAFVQTQIAAIAAGVSSFSAGTTGLTPATATTGAVTLAGTLAVANGGTGTATPSLLAGSNVVVTGTWPNQTISASGGGGGGTAGIFLAAASGALANGDKIVINADGTVSAVNAATQSAGTAATYSSSAISNSGNTVQIASVYDSTNNKTVVVYVTSSGGFAVVGTVSGTSISFGTPVLFESSVSGVSVAFDSVNSKIVIGYTVSGAGLKSIIGTVSGTAISFGTAVTFGTDFLGNVTVVYDTANSKAVFSYRNTSTTYGEAVVGTVSGTSISFGTAAVFNAFQTFYPYSVYAAGKVVIAFADGANSYYGYAIVGTVSGTSISFGTKAVFNSATLDNIRATYDTTNAKVVIGYADIGNSNYGTASVGTVSGTSISFGTKVVFTARYTTWFGMAYSPVVNRVMFTCWDASIGASYGTSIPGAVSGTSISFTAPYVYNSVNTFQPAPVYDSTAQKLVIAYSNTTSGTGAAQVVTAAANMTATNYIGISDAAYASGAIATIQTVGSIDDAQTGLTAGLLYYVQPNGTLASTAGSPSVVAGTAVSAVKLIIKG
jgi:hypothetical protein